MRRFNSGLVEKVLTISGVAEDIPIESKMVSNAIRSAQTQVESQNFETRKNVLKYDNVMSRQREVIYGERRLVLEGKDLKDQVTVFMQDTLAAYVDSATASGYAEEWDLDTLWTHIKKMYPISFSPKDLEKEFGGRESLDSELLKDKILSDVVNSYSQRESEISTENLRQIERNILLSVVDRKWREHLYEMDYLQDGIGLRAMAQRDPLVEYQREGYELFAAMMEGIKEEVAGFLFNVEISSHSHEVPKPVEQLGFNNATTNKGSTMIKNDVARNAPCPCGSGKKYKRCHLLNK
jgi:preprotein translocase subunit SecA